MFPSELTLKQQFAKLEVTGREKAATRDAIVLVGTPAEGSPVKMFFDCRDRPLDPSDHYPARTRKARRKWRRPTTTTGSLTVSNAPT